MTQAQLTPSPLTVADEFSRAGVQNTEPFRGITMPFPLRDYQVQGLNESLRLPRYGLYFEPRCVSGDTEFLTPTGWKRIDEYREGDLVCQYNSADKTGEWVTPNGYITSEEEEVIRIRVKKGNGGVSTDQLLSSNHTVFFELEERDAKTGIREKKGHVFSEAKDVFSLLDNKKSRTYYRIPTAFNIKTTGCLDISDIDLRVMVMTIADAAFLRAKADGTLRVRLEVKKNRKADRAEELLTEGGYSFTKAKDVKRGTTKFYYSPKRADKEFTEYYWGASAHQLQVVAEEVFHWDGNNRGSGGKEFNSCRKQSAEFVQYACIGTGMTASLSSYERSNQKHNTLYRVITHSGANLPQTILPRHVTRMARTATMYCFQVPSGLLVLRRKGRVFITGNCGKTPVFLLNALYCANYQVGSIVICPPILFGQVKEEWDNFNGNPFPLTVFNQGPKSRDKLVQDWKGGAVRQPSVLVMSKEIFNKEWERIVPMGYLNIIADEIHQGVQSSGTNYYSSLLGALRYEGARLIASTGTPIYTTATNCYPLISLTNPTAYQNEGAFNRMHVTTKRIQVTNRRGKKVDIDIPDKAINMELLHRNLYANAIKKTRVGTLKMDAPDIAIRQVALNPTHMKTYQTLVKQKVLQVGTRMIDARQSSKLRQVAMQIVLSPENYTQPRVLQNRMIEHALEIMDEYPKGTRAVLVANYRQSVRTIRDHLMNLNKKNTEWDTPCVVFGENTPAANSQNADAFKAGKHRFIVLNPDSGGVGLKLGDVCDMVIFLEPVSSYGKFDQVLSRVMLVEKQRPVSAYVLVATGTLWERNVKLMLDRTAQLRVANQSSDDLLKELLGG